MGNNKESIKVSVTDKVLDYNDFVDFSPLFCETGSAAGDGIQRALNAGFHRVKSVEAFKEWYIHCVDRFDGQHVQMYFGSSIDMLPEMIKNLNFPAVFFLDAHPAGPGTAGHDEIIAGNGNFGQDHIITEELKIILAHRNDHLIIIDDLAYNSKEDANYMAMCLKANPNYTFEYYDEQLPQTELRKNKVLVCRP